MDLKKKLHSKTAGQLFCGWISALFCSIFVPHERVYALRNIEHCNAHWKVAEIMRTCHLFGFCSRSGLCECSANKSFFGEEKFFEEGLGGREI